MSMHVRLSLPACFASADAPSLAPLVRTMSHLDRRRSAASNASCRPKIKQSPPLVTNTEPRASRTAVGGAGGEDGASIDLGLHGRWCRGRNGRNRRQVGRGGG